MPRLTTAELVNLGPVIPVVVIDDPARGVALAKALLAGGVRVIEVTLRTPHALEVIQTISGEVPDMVVGAGTVTSPTLVGAAVGHGAQFLVSPGATERLLDAMDTAPVPCLPGAASPSEVLRVLERGQREMKFFPAEASGGRAFLRALGAALPEARFCPTGGITPTTAPEYLALPNVACVGGTWLAPPEALNDQDWNRIEQLAAQTTQLS